MRIGVWNVRTLNGSGKLIKEMEVYRLDILGLSEVRGIDFGEGTKMDPPFCILEELEKMLKRKRVLECCLVDMLERAI
jgi:hypothetical protein